MYSTALPPISTLLPSCLHNNFPPLDESCLALNSVFPVFSTQNGTNEVWADPVTGSSSTPVDGKKHLDTKSQLSPGAVTIKPLALISLSFEKSGFKLIIWFSA